MKCFSVPKATLSHVHFGCAVGVQNIGIAEVRSFNNLISFSSSKEAVTGKILHHV